MKFIDTRLLRVGYDELEGDRVHTIVLLHGWPDSTLPGTAFAPRLAAAGYRVIIRALRGFAPTRLLRAPHRVPASSPRSGAI